MKIAFTSKGTTWASQMDTRFGRTVYFLIYDDEKEKLTPVDNSDTGKEAHGAGPIAAKILFDLDAKILVTGNGPGGNAKTILEKTGIKVYTGAGNMTVKEAFEAYQNKTLPEF